MAAIQSNTEVIRQEIEKMQAQLNATSAAMDSAPADKLGELSIKASGLQNALALLARRLRAAELAAIDAEIEAAESAVKAASATFEKAVHALGVTKQSLEAARVSVGNASAMTDQAIEVFAQATATVARAQLVYSRADYAASEARDRVRQLKTKHAELAGSRILA